MGPREMVSKIKNFLEASEIAILNAAEKLENELMVSIDDEALLADLIIHPEPQSDSESDSFTNDGDDGDNNKKRKRTTAPYLPSSKFDDIKSASEF